MTLQGISYPKSKMVLRGQDLNLRPSGYEPDELPNCSTPRRYKYSKGKNGGGRGIRTPAGCYTPVGFQDRSLQPDLGIPPCIMDPVGLEPTTGRL